MKQIRDRMFAWSAATYEVFERAFVRTMILAVLTIVGLWVVDKLVDSGIADRFALVRRFPDFIPFMMASAKMTFIEMSLFWIRFSTQPKVDVQEVADTASMSSTGAAFVYFTNALMWAMRVGVFLYLLEH